MKAKPFADPVWVDVLTGDAYALPKSAVKEGDGGTTYEVIAYDSPAFITDASLLTLDKSAEVVWKEEQRQIEARLRETSKLVAEARFYGPFPKDAPYRSVAELEAAGHRPRTVRAGADESFDLKALVPPEQYVGEVGNPRDPPKLSGYVVFRVRPPRAMSMRLLERCDWFWSVYANGDPVAVDRGGVIESWRPAADLSLAEGWNEIVFRTCPGSGGRWDVWLRLLDPHDEFEVEK